MYLAFRELRHDVRHFSLITAMITLVSLMVFFLTGLALGLYGAMTQAVRSWPAETVVLSSTANDSVLASLIPDDTKLQVDGEQALFGLTNATIEPPTSAAASTANEGDTGKQLNAFALALSPDSFIAPKVSEGQLWSTSGTVSVAASLKEEGYQLGDTLQLAQSERDFKIVGFVDGATYSAYPVIYMGIEDWQGLGVQFDGKVSGVALSGVAEPPADMTALSKSDFIQAIPGVRAQNITFGLMIGALIVISAVVLGVFTFVLTLQKQRLFGVLKTQGISNAMIGWSVLWQTAILAVFASLFAVAVSTAVGLVLPEGVPFAIPWLAWAVIGAVIVAFSLIGALFSVRVATRVDPLVALRGGE